MRTFRYQILPALLLGSSVLFTFACGARDEQRSETVAETGAGAETGAYPDEDGAPRDPELRSQARSVDVGEEPPPAVSVEERAEIEARERRLAARQAELDARERVLREREQQGQARISPKPAPRQEAPPRVDRQDEAEPEEARSAPEPAREEPEAREEREEENAVEPEEMPEPLAASVSVPSGTVLDVEFLESLGSESSTAGDTFRVRVSGDVVEDGVVAIPGGSEVLGVVTEAVPLRRKVGGRARLALRFTDLVLPSGATVPLDASFLEEGRNETGKDAATIGGGAAGGAVLGRVISKKDRSKGAIIGAIIGAAVGTAIASKTAGQEVVIPEGTVISLKLDTPVEVRARR